MTYSEVAIVGGGICGLAIGWYLAERGVGATIFERAEAGKGATWASAGVLSPRLAERSAQLGMESLRAWPKFAREIEDISRVDVDFRDEGAIRLAFDENERDELEAFYRVLHRQEK